MAAGEIGCDGCGCAMALEESTIVVLPTGDRVCCCPDCEQHARSLDTTSESTTQGTQATDSQSTLDQRRSTCDGCRSTVLESALEELVLQDGTVLSCCASCASEAPRSSGPESTDSETAEGLESETDTSADTGDNDQTRRCSQCTDNVAVERFRVTTVDDRSERLCPTCKERFEERGIVKAVDMRATRARDVLGVEQGATADEVRKAYHQQVKRAHPDRPSGSRSAFQLVTDAYDRLQTEYSER